jgi:uncharacterized membrane protein
LIRERCLHLVFRVALWVKGAFAAGELASGIGAFLVDRGRIVSWVETITHGELAEDRDDPIATFLVHSAHHLSASGQHFIGLYLVAHGAIKLALVAGLLRTMLWMYPAAIAIFAAFVAYQLYRFTGSHSPWLLVLSAIDAIVIVLTWHEYRYLRVEHAPSR